MSGWPSGREQPRVCSVFFPIFLRGRGGGTRRGGRVRKPGGDRALTSERAKLRSSVCTWGSSGWDATIRVAHGPAHFRSVSTGKSLGWPGTNYRLKSAKGERPPEPPWQAELGPPPRHSLLPCSHQNGEQPALSLCIAAAGAPAGHGPRSSGRRARFGWRRRRAWREWQVRIRGWCRASVSRIRDVACISSLFLCHPESCHHELVVSRPTNLAHGRPQTWRKQGRHSCPRVIFGDSHMIATERTKAGPAGPSFVVAVRRPIATPQPAGQAAVSSLSPGLLRGAQRPDEVT